MLLFRHAASPHRKVSDSQKALEEMKAGMLAMGRARAEEGWLHDLSSLRLDMVPLISRDRT